jgi:hypothetical protein
MTEKLPFLRKDTDHQIELEKMNEKSQKYSEILYTTWQKKLLVLQKH